MHKLFSFAGGKRYDRGAVLLVAVIFFLVISLTVIFGVAGPILNQVKTTKEYVKAKQTYALAEAGVEDVVYRLRKPMAVSSTETLTLNGYSTETSIADVGSTKEITSSADVENIVRKVKIDLTLGTGIAFNYGMQAGNGGVIMDGGSTINGNIYSNGSIDAVSAVITGTAVAADSSNLAPDQVNDTPSTPSSSIVFRNVSATRDFAESFQVSSGDPISKVQFYIKKVGSPANATVKILADNSGSPSTTAIPIGTATLNAGLVTTSYGWTDVVFPSPQSLIPGETYWVVIQNGTQSTSNHFIIGSNTSGIGTAKTGVYGGTWNATSTTGYVKTYLGGITSYIGHATYSSGLLVGDSAASTGDAWASLVKGTTAYGHMYCTTGTNNNKPCDTTHGEPSPQPMPFSDANIQSWKDAADLGGTITGNYNVGFANATTGPKHITGNLLVNGGGTLTLTGPLWVEGNITITGGGKLKIPANYGRSSESVVADGIISVSGGGSVGSGTAGSYLFVVSTSKCPNDVGCTGPAIYISGGAGAIAANAQEGTVTLDGGASIKAVVGNTITISGGSTVTYDSGLASPSFTSGPSGGYVVSSWNEVQ